MTGKKLADREAALSPFGIWLAHELSVRGWSQADFCRISNTNSRRLSDWLYRSNPDLDSIVKIADTLNVPIQTVAVRVLDLPTQQPPPLAEEIGRLAAGIPEKLLVPIAITLRALQDPDLQSAALKDLER